MEVSAIVTPLPWKHHRAAAAGSSRVSGGTVISTHTAAQFCKGTACPLRYRMGWQTVWVAVLLVCIYLSPVFTAPLECISSYEDAVMADLSCQPDIPRKREPRLRSCLLQISLKMSAGHFP